MAQMIAASRNWIAALALVALGPIAVASARAEVADSRNPPIPVEIATAERRDVSVYISELGTVQAFNTVTIRSRVDGALEQVFFKEGRDVRKGDLLALIDPRPYQARLDEAKAKLDQDTARLANARLILGRDTQLAARDVLSVQASDDQKSQVAELAAQVEQDKALIAAAQAELSYTRITSPIDGRAGLRLVDEGNTVRADDPGGIVVIRQVHPIAAICTVAEDEVGSIRSALAAGRLEAVALSRENGTILDQGTVELMDNTIDPRSGTIKLKSSFPNRGDRLWPGQFIDVRMRIATTTGALTVPAGAIQRGPDGTFVYVVADGTVFPAPVSTGSISEGVAVVESGLAEGVRVVTAGQYRLFAGARVVPAPSSQARGTR